MEPQDYAFFRSSLEAGRALHEAWKATGVVKADAKQLLDALGEVIPLAVVSAVTSASSDELVDEDAVVSPEQQARIATKAFGFYPQLRQALDAAAGQTYTDILAEAPGAADGDIGWWAVAVAIGGVLSRIGKLAFRGAVVAKIVAWIFYGLAAADILPKISQEGYRVIAEVADEIKNATGDAARSTGRLLWWVLAGAGVIGVTGLAFWAYNVAQEDKERRRARRELASAS